MRRPPLRFPLWVLLVLVAVVGLVLGADRLWRRAEYYRKQAALCALFELGCSEDAVLAAAKLWANVTPEELSDDVRHNLAVARYYSRLKAVYRRLARYPWESLPPVTPTSVTEWSSWSGWDFENLSASEVEQMAARWAPFF